MKAVKYNKIPWYMIPMFQSGAWVNNIIYPKVADNSQLNQLLNTPRATGYEQNIDNQNLQFKYRQEKQQEELFQFEKEKFTYQKEADKIANEYKQRLLDEQLKQQKFNNAITILNTNEKFRDQLNIDINPGDEEKMRQLYLKEGIIDDKGNFLIPEDPTEFNNFQNKIFKITRDPLTKESQRLSVRSKALKAALDDRAKRITEIKQDPTKSYKYADLEKDLHDLTFELAQLTSNPSTEEDYNNFEVKLKSSELKLSNIGKEELTQSIESANQARKLGLLTSQANIAKTEAQIGLLEEQKDLTAAKKRLVDSENEIREKYKDNPEELAKQLAALKGSADYRKLVSAGAVSDKVDNLTEAERKELEVQRVMKHYNISELDAKNLIAKADKGELYGITSTSQLGAEGGAIVYDKRGIIDFDKSVFVTPKGENIGLKPDEIKQLIQQVEPSGKVTAPMEFRIGSLFQDIVDKGKEVIVTPISKHPLYGKPGIETNSVKVIAKLLGYDSKTDIDKFATQYDDNLRLLHGINGITVENNKAFIPLDAFSQSFVSNPNVTGGRFNPSATPLGSTVTNAEMSLIQSVGSVDTDNISPESLKTTSDEVIANWETVHPNLKSIAGFLNSRNYDGLSFSQMNSNSLSLTNSSSFISELERFSKDTGATGVTKTTTGYNWLINGKILEIKVTNSGININLRGSGVTLKK